MSETPQSLGLASQVGSTRERARTLTSMTPSRPRAGSSGRVITYATTPTSLGLLMMAATDYGLCFVQLGDSDAEMRERLRAEYPAATLETMQPRANAALQQWMQALYDYLDGSRTRFELPADVRGTPFQMQVWDHLRQIPYGEVRTYKQPAAAVGRPKAIRAAASACAANRIALAIPCHRVIRGDGGLGDYRWGIERKRALIERERAAGATTS